MYSLFALSYTVHHMKSSERVWNLCEKFLFKESTESVQIIFGIMSYC